MCIRDSSKNARFRVRNPWISLVGFLAAVAVIARCV